MTSLLKPCIITYLCSLVTIYGVQARLIFEDSSDPKASHYILPVFLTFLCIQESPGVLLIVQNPRLSRSGMGPGI